jgi:hypothetical protein
MVIHHLPEVKMAEQQKESWWSRRKKAKEARKKSEAGVYESHPTWIECQANLKRYSKVSFSLAFVFIAAWIRGITKDGLGFGVDASSRIGNNLIVIGMFWFLLSIILVRVFRAFALSSYSKDFRQEARNLMGRTSDSDPSKRWNTAQLVGHLGRQLAQVPQDGVILTDIIQLEGYSLTALIDAAERSNEKGVLQAIVKFQRLDGWAIHVLLVVSAMFSGLVSIAFLRLVNHFPGRDPLALIAVGYCLTALLVLVLAFQKGLDPEKWIGAVGKLFIGIACAVLIGLGVIKGIDVVRAQMKIGADEPKKTLVVPSVSPTK